MLDLDGDKTVEIVSYEASVVGFVLDWQDAPVAAPVSDAGARPRLSAPYPNPFNPSVKLPFVLQRDSRVQILVYDVAGRLLRDLIGSQQLTAGEHSYAWDGTDDSGRPVASGSYYYQLEVDGAPAGARTLILLR